MKISELLQGTHPTSVLFEPDQSSMVY